jgi:hypothetical protein
MTHLKNVTTVRSSALLFIPSVTNWETNGATLVGYCYAVRHGMTVHLVNACRVSHLQRYGVTVRGKVTSVYRTLATESVVDAMSRIVGN